MTQDRLELRIRQLVLDAAPAPSPAALCTAIEAELAALLGLAPAVGHPQTARKERDDRSDRAVGPAHAGTTRLGRHIALALHRALRPQAPSGPRPKAGDGTT